MLRDYITNERDFLDSIKFGAKEVAVKIEGEEIKFSTEGGKILGRAVIEDGKCLSWETEEMYLTVHSFINRNNNWEKIDELDAFDMNHDPDNRTVTFYRQFMDAQKNFTNTIYNEALKDAGVPNSKEEVA